MNIQKIFDMMGDAERLTRSRYHVTLSQLIDFLDNEDQKAVVLYNVPKGHDNWFPTVDVCSYRGYYSDLCLEPSPQPTPPITVEVFLNVMRTALNATFEGYKGGDFVMDENTPLWVAQYSRTGLAVMAMSVLTHEGNNFVILTLKEI